MRILFLTVAMLLCWAGTCLGLTVHDLGRHGKTYPIAEKDMAELVPQRASRLDLAALKERVWGKTRRFDLPRELRVDFPEATRRRQPGVFIVQPTKSGMRVMFITLKDTSRWSVVASVS
jgi:hypothetical protein